MSCLTYSAGQLYAATATDDPFVMTSSTNGVDIVATLAALPLADKWGRRPSMMSAYVMAAACYLVVAAIDGEKGYVSTVRIRFLLKIKKGIGEEVAERWEGDALLRRTQREDILGGNIRK